MTNPFEALKVLVLGAHTGAYQFFLDRFPAPGDYLVAKRFRDARDGGKGSNQAIAAARLGAAVTLLSAVGDDDMGRASLDYMQEHGVDVEHVRISQTLPTGLGSGFYRDDGTVMGATYLGANVEVTREYLDGKRAVYASGFDVFMAQCELPIESTLYGLKLAESSGIPLTVLDPSPPDALIGRALPRVNVLRPNEPEARVLAGLDPTGDEPIEAVASRLAERYAFELLIVTRGANPCYVHTAGVGRIIPVPPVKAVDSSGAGDCFNAALALGLAAGWDLMEAVEFALRAASYSVQFPDSWPAFPTYAEVLKSYDGPALSS